MPPDRTVENDVKTAFFQAYSFKMGQRSTFSILYLYMVVMSLDAVSLLIRLGFQHTAYSGGTDYNPPYIR